MAALSVTMPTIMDIAQLMDENGRIRPVLEILNQQCEMLEDMTWIEGNRVDGHTGAVRTGIPEPTWRKFNQGVQPSKATTTTVSVGTGMLEDYGEVDAKLADMANNRDRFRLSQDVAKLEGFTEKLQRYVLYGNSGTEPEAITGLMNYYNDKAAANAENIIDAGGTGTDNASIVLVVWGGEMGITGIYPKGSQAGFKHEDLGRKTKENAGGVTGALMEVYRSHYEWDCGLFVGDWRQCVRIANIDKSNLTKDASGSSADLADLMSEAMEYVHNLKAGRAAWYMSRKVKIYLNKQRAKAIGNSTLTLENVGGVKSGGDSFGGVPIRRVDAMAADETRVV